MAGITRRAIAASSRWRSVSAAPMIRLREAASSCVRSVELFDLGGELDLQPGVAEGDRRLVGDVGEQPVLVRADVAPGRQAQA